MAHLTSSMLSRSRMNLIASTDSPVLKGEWGNEQGLGLGGGSGYRYHYWSICGD